MIPTILSIVMLLLALTNIFPYGFFQILRWVVCGTSIYRAIRCKESGHEKWMWFFIVTAVLFNPVLPIILDRAIWIVIDIIVAVIFIASLTLYKNDKQPELTVDDEDVS